MRYEPSAHQPLMELGGLEPRPPGCDAGLRRRFRDLIHGLLEAKPRSYASDALGSDARRYPPMTLGSGTETGPVPVWRA
jgi:hypothetical protein